MLVNSLTEHTQPVCIGHSAHAHPPDPTRGSTPRTRAACYSQPPGQTDLETEVRDHPDHCRAVALPHLPQTFFLDQIAEESRLQHGTGANLKPCPHVQIDIKIQLGLHCKRIACIRYVHVCRAVCVVGELHGCDMANCMGALCCV